MFNKKAKNKFPETFFLKQSAHDTNIKKLLYVAFLC